MRTKANPARIVVAIFTIAIFYGSVCLTTCAIGFCPDQVQRTAGHDCDQTPAHNSHQSGDQAPDKRDCSQHQHPDSFLAKSGDLSRSQLSVATLSAAVDVEHSLVLSMTSAETPTLVPPLRLSSPLNQKISVQRI